MTITRYHTVPYDLFGRSTNIDIRYKKVNYTEKGSTETRLGKMLYYPLNPGCLSIAGEFQYWVSDDNINPGVRYFIIENLHSDTGRGFDYFPLCYLFYYIENKQK